MLNELIRLSNTLSTNGIMRDEWHKDYQLLPTSNTYRLWLKDDASIKSIELMDKQLAKHCRYYCKSNKETFPAFNIAPLFNVCEEDAKYLKKLKDNKADFDKERIRAICKDSFWTNNLLKNIDNCLKCTIPNVQEDNIAFAVMQLASKIDAQRLYQIIEEFVFENLQDDLDTLLPFIFYDGKDKNKNKIRILLDFYDWDISYSHPLASESAAKEINRFLLTSSVSSTKKKSKVKVDLDAYGDSYVYMDETFPIVKIPNCFDVKLRTMFSGHKCQKRYNAGDDATFPISVENRKAAKSALEWIIPLYK